MRTESVSTYEKYHLAPHLEVHKTCVHFKGYLVHTHDNYLDNRVSMISSGLKETYTREHFQTTDADLRLILV